MDCYDIVVAGAGPAGLHTARRAAMRGANVLIVEEHYEIGKPMQCAGLVTPRVFEIVGDSPRRAIVNSLRGAHIYSPSGMLINVDGKCERAVVIDRSSFDAELARLAIRAGAKVKVGSKVEGARSLGMPSKGLELSISSHDGIQKINTKLLVAATGSQSRLPRMFGIPPPREILSGFEVEYAGAANMQRDFVELFAGSKVANDFFAWIIPLSSEGNALAGLCVANSHSNAFEAFSKFKHKIASKFIGTAKPIRYLAGTIPTGLLAKTYADNFFVVGDAACQVKPLTGGGVYTGLKAAEQSAKVAVEALESGDLSNAFLARYQKAWMAEIGKELKRGWKLRELYLRLSDEEMDEILAIINDPKLLETISKYGDIDYPSKVSMVMFKKVPRLVKFAPRILGSLLFARA